MICCGLKITENHHVLVNQFHGNFRSKTLGCRKAKSVFRDVKLCFDPLSPHDALKHHFTSLKTDLISLQLTVLEEKFL